MLRPARAYVSVAGAPVRNAADAAYFVAWVDRLIAAARSNTAWNTDTEKQAVLSMFRGREREIRRVGEVRLLNKDD